MDTAVAFHLLEKGEARCLCASILLLRVRGRFFISFDGEEWEESDSEMVKGEFDD